MNDWSPRQHPGATPRSRGRRAAPGDPPPAEPSGAPERLGPDAAVGSGDATAAGGGAAPPGRGGAELRRRVAEFEAENAELRRARRAAAEAEAGQAALRGSEARHRQIVDGVVDYAIIAMDVHGKVTRWNEGARRITGWTEQEVLGGTIERIFAPEDLAADRLRLEMREAAARGRTPDARWHLRRDGRRFWAEGETRTLLGDAGAPVGFVKVMADRTAERHRERRLALLARTSAGLLEAEDPDEALGPALEEGAGLLGFDQSYSYVLSADGTRLRLTSSAGVGPEIRAALRDVASDQVQCGVVVETMRPLILRDLQASTEPRYAIARGAGLNAYAGFPVASQGKLHGVMSFGSFDRPAFDDEAISFFATLARYMSVVRGRLDAAAALREREERLRLVVENARDYAILTTDPEGRIDGWLPGAANVFGWSAEEAVGRPVAATFTPEDRERGEHEKEMETARREGAAPNVRWHLRKDGSRVFIEGSMKALRDPDGSIRGFLKIGQDVTGRKAAEERQALLMREVDHRAKNALAVVQSAVRLTPDRDPAAFKRAVEGRITALARAQAVLAEDRWSGADLRALLAGELAPFLGDRRAELDGPAVALPPGAAQPVAMAVHELATNAVKHGALSAAAGRLSVSWRLEGRRDGAPLLRLRWAEAGGPPVAGAPERRGFGSRVLDGTVRGQLGGWVSLAWAASGLVCDVEVPLRPEAAPAGAADASAADRSAPERPA